MPTIFYNLWFICKFIVLRINNRKIKDNRLFYGFKGDKVKWLLDTFLKERGYLEKSTKLRYLNFRKETQPFGFFYWPYFDEQGLWTYSYSYNHEALMRHGDSLIMEIEWCILLYYLLEHSYIDANEINFEGYYFCKHIVYLQRAIDGDIGKMAKYDKILEKIKRTSWIF